MLTKKNTFEKSKNTCNIGNHTGIAYKKTLLTEKNTCAISKNTCTTGNCKGISGKNTLLTGKNTYEIVTNTFYISKEMLKYTTVQNILKLTSLLKRK